MTHGTDYDLPRGWEALSPEEMDSWFKAERCRRQAMNQDTRFAETIRTAQRRAQRRADARNTVHIGAGPWNISDDGGDE